jgi:hypothetical protein
MYGKCDFIFSLLNATPVAFLNGWTSWILPHPLQEADGRMDPSSREEIHSGHAEASEGQGLVERTEEISDVHDCLSIQEMLIDCWYHVLLDMERANAPFSKDACSALISTSSTCDVFSHMIEGNSPKRPLQKPRAQPKSSSTKTAILSSFCKGS